jgi:hypothetical protein
LSDRRKTGTGAVLAVVGGAGIVLAPMLGWSDAPSPWALVLGFVFGCMAGAGATLAVYGLVRTRAKRNA